MNAIDAAFSGLLDYAGLYPPANLDMQTAVANYVGWREQEHSWMLGRFLIDIARLEEFREAAGEDFRGIRLSVLAPIEADPEQIVQKMREGFRIESAEIKCNEPLKITRLKEKMCPDFQCYFEIPVEHADTSAVDALAAVNGRAKLRMGGTVAEAFPASEKVVERLRLLADRCVPFKATAGLHHPLRSVHPLTYDSFSDKAKMHGFVNLLCAAALIDCGGSAVEARGILEEEDPGAFRVTGEFVEARDCRWDAKQLREVRGFFTSFGSCSFTEPVEDLKALGWI